MRDDRAAFPHLVPDVTMREAAHYLPGRALVITSTPDLPMNARWLDTRRGVVLFGCGPEMTDRERIVRRVRQEARQAVRDGFRAKGFWPYL